MQEELFRSLPYFSIVIILYDVTMILERQLCPTTLLEFDQIDDPILEHFSYISIP